MRVGKSCSGSRTRRAGRALETRRKGVGGWPRGLAQYVVPAGDASIRRNSKDTVRPSGDVAMQPQKRPALRGGPELLHLHAVRRARPGPGHPGQGLQTGVGGRGRGGPRQNGESQGDPAEDMRMSISMSASRASLSTPNLERRREGVLKKPRRQRRRSDKRPETAASRGAPGRRSGGRALPDRSRCRSGSCPANSRNSRTR